MRTTTWLLALISLATLSLVVSCGGGGGAAGDTSTYDPSTTGNTQYRQDMRSLARQISACARGLKPGFIVIPMTSMVVFMVSQ